MNTRSLTLLALVAAAVVLSGCVDNASQPEQAATPDAGSKPALAQSSVRGLTPEQIAAYENGEGANMALPAELNGYPGPTHVLEMERKLELTPEQKAAMEKLRDEMRAEAIAAGRELLTLHKALDDGFRNGTLDEATLAQMLEEIAHAEADLRFIHLRTHFQTADMLTSHQKALYIELRGYGKGDHGSHDH